MFVTSPNVISHSQDVASESWEIEHGMPIVPSVTVAIMIGDKLETILPKAIKHEPNKVIIEFSKPRTGKATLS